MRSRAPARRCDSGGRPDTRSAWRRAAGAVAGKADGGGTVTFLAASRGELCPRQALDETPDCSALPCRICHEGVRSWVVG